MQGRELEKINLRLERAKQTIGQNEKEFQGFARTFADTMKKWEGEYKIFCDVSPCGRWRPMSENADISGDCDE